MYAGFIDCDTETKQVDTPTCTTPAELIKKNKLSGN
jgi:hypothetical protein